MRFFAVALVSVLSFSSGAFAEVSGCVNAAGVDIAGQPDAIIAAIRQKTSCYEASQLAGNCSYGSSMDFQITAPAVTVCQAELRTNRATAADRALLTRMNASCDRQGRRGQGTLARSINAFCHLRALEFVVNVTGDPN